MCVTSDAPPAAIPVTTAEIDLLLGALKTVIPELLASTKGSDASDESDTAAHH
jgi:hypothetical protein